MSSSRPAVIVFLIVALGTLLGGCAANSPKQSSIPWSRPAGWEGQIPGMGQPSGR